MLFDIYRKIGTDAGSLLQTFSCRKSNDALNRKKCQNARRDPSNSKTMRSELTNVCAREHGQKKEAARAPPDYRSQDKDGLRVGWTERRNSAIYARRDIAVWSTRLPFSPGRCRQQRRPLYFLPASCSKNRGSCYQTIDAAIIKVLRAIFAIEGSYSSIGG